MAAPTKITVLFIAGALQDGEEAHEGAGGAVFEPPLRLDREIREVEWKVAAGLHRDRLIFRHLQATQIKDITDGLNRHRPDIVHFSGHGNGSTLLFDRPSGERGNLEISGR